MIYSKENMTVANGACEAKVEYYKSTTRLGYIAPSDECILPQNSSDDLNFI